MPPSPAQAAVFSRPRLTLSLSQESSRRGSAGLHRPSLLANHAANEGWAGGAGESRELPSRTDSEMSMTQC
jgi:hypothetical protein